MTWTASRPSYELIFNAVAPCTMVKREGVDFLTRSVYNVLTDKVPGDFVECGVWRGGCGIAMLLAQHYFRFPYYEATPRHVYLLDSFAGMAAPDPLIDGAKAVAWHQHAGSDNYHNNCRAELDEVRRNVLNAECKGAVGFSVKAGDFQEGRDFDLWPGDFTHTFPWNTLRGELTDGIALLRIDCDWYDAVSPCLDELVPLVAPGGIVILDDYYAWDGCARAVHEYLATRDLPYRLRSITGDCGAYFVKEDK